MGEQLACSLAEWVYKNGISIHGIFEHRNEILIHAPTCMKLENNMLNERSHIHVCVSIYMKRLGLEAEGKQGTRSDCLMNKRLIREVMETLGN